RRIAVVRQPQLGAIAAANVDDARAVFGDAFGRVRRAVVVAAARQTRLDRRQHDQRALQAAAGLGVAEGEHDLLVVGLDRVFVRVVGRRIAGRRRRWGVLGRGGGG